MNDPKEHTKEEREDHEKTHLPSGVGADIACAGAASSFPIEKQHKKLR